MKKIVSFLVALSIFFAFSIPAYAFDSSVAHSSFWDVYVKRFYGATEEIGFPLLGRIVAGMGILTGSVTQVCPESEDHLHHGSADSFSAGPSRGVSIAHCICDHCALSFDVTVNNSDFQAAYDTYVSDLQTDLGSATLIDGGVRVYFQPTGYSYSSKVTDETVVNLGATSVNGTLVTVNLYSSASYGNTSNASFQLWYDTGIEAPFSANYTLGSYGSFSPNTYFKSWSWDELTSTGVVSQGDFVYAAGSVYQSNSYHRRIDFSVTSNTIVTGDFSYVCWVDLVPVAGLPSVTDINTDQSTRVGSLVGDFVSDNDSTVYKDVQIVDEANGTYYNPVTGNYNTITNWSYDYSDRSYTVTTDSNNTYTITYGDEHVTINEGDTIYNLYYTVPDSGSGGSGDSGGGSGDSGGEKETIWDKLGNLLGTIGTGILDMVEAVLGKLLDGLNSLAEMIGGKLKALVEMILDWFSEIPALFSGFLGFLSGLFSFLPSEVVMLLEFGLAAVIFIAIFKAIFRR